MNLIGLDQIETGNRLNIMIDRATCYYTNFFFYISFLPPICEKIVLRARSKLPHLSLNHLKSLLGRKCLLPLINLPDFDMNYLTPDISSDRDNLPIHET